MSIKISNKKKKEGLYFKVRKVAVQDFFQKRRERKTKNNGVNVKCKYIDRLTNCPSSIPITQARSAKGRTSLRQFAGTASIVLLKDVPERRNLTSDR